MEIRHPREGDVLPIPLEFASYNPDWVWLMGNAVLIAAPAHDTVMLLRLIRFGEMPPMWMHRLLRQAIKESRDRGYRRYLTWLANGVQEERKLQDIARKYGANFEPFTGNIVMGVI